MKNFVTKNFLLLTVFLPSSSYIKFAWRINSNICLYIIYTSLKRKKISLQISFHSSYAMKEEQKYRPVLRFIIFILYFTRLKNVKYTIRGHSIITFTLRGRGPIKYERCGHGGGGVNKIDMFAYSLYFIQLVFLKHPSCLICSKKIIFCR